MLVSSTFTTSGIVSIVSPIRYSSAENGITGISAEPTIRHQFISYSVGKASGRGLSNSGVCHQKSQMPLHKCGDFQEMHAIVRGTRHLFLACFAAEDPTSAVTVESFHSALQV